MKLFDGCSSKNASGSAARYREWASDDVLTLATCFWRQHAFFSLGEHASHLFDLELPNAYQVECLQRDWCGRSYRYAWDDDAVRVDVRTSIPGPLFSLEGTHLRLRTFTGSEWRDFQDLESGQIINFMGAEDIDGGRIYYVSSDKVPALLICSQPLKRVGVITHRHYDLEFSEAGARVMVVPLLFEDDVPREADKIQPWLRLIAEPPLHITEQFSLHQKSLRIHAQSDAATICLSPMLSLLGKKDALITELTAGKPLLKSWCGPIVMVDASHYECDISAQWMFAQLADGQAATGVFSDIPEEMSYAGDATWEPGSCMDQLFSIRSWANYAHHAPDALRADIFKLLQLPTVSEFKEAVEIIDDFDGHGTWGRWRSMWAHNGDACYDIDWYNGFGLSGLARAVASPIESYAQEAKALSIACKEQRKALFDYFVVFMDWMHHCPMTDPHGWMWNADCIHNGMEGIIAEAQLRSAEGDHEGAAFAYYIAARTGVALRAAMELGHWHQQFQNKATHTYAYKRMVTWCATEGVSDREEAPIVGIQGLCGFSSFTWCTTATRNPYVLAGHNPAWSALLREHWSHKSVLKEDWEAHDPDRYKDWVAFYIGTDWQERRQRGDQEARIQASVFYNLAPEVCYRFWCLGESAASIEERFATDLHLNEQIMLRSARVLEYAQIDWGGIG